MPDNKTDRSVPAGYEWPGADAIASTTSNLYWLTEQVDWDGATPLFMVMCADRDGQKIVAEKCHRQYGVDVVDALRSPHNFANR